MLDLCVKNKSFMEIKLENEEVLHILPPKRKLIAKLEGMKDAKVTDELYDAIADVLSNNTDGKVFHIDDLDDFGVDEIAEILNVYVEFIKSIQKK